jgi:NAD(P)-dependent dehydrogenase (short-subunit alcohol dehydrogenase family)
VVFISSISGRVAAPLLGPYAASKFALEALADSLRRELLPWGIRVSVIQPGRINTPIWGKSLAAAEQLLATLPDEAHQLYGKMIASAREGVQRPEKGAPMDEVVKAVAHALTSSQPRTRYLIGRDARVAAGIVHLLPDRVIDRLFAYQRKIRK